MSQESKRTKSAKYVNKYETIFACPICKASMEVENDRSLVCKKGHSFDFAKQGYINLNLRHSKSKYDKQLFEARREFIIKTQFFEPMIEKVVENVAGFAQTKKEPVFILDTGCGEGSHLASICKSVQTKVKSDVVGIGIDIAKDGLLVAAKNYEKKIWVVGDLAEAPFEDKSFQSILNILSPSNYGEFRRLLSDDGIVIKVVPQKNYLKELREHVFRGTEKQNYSNENTVKLFKEEFTTMEVSRITYTKKLEKQFLPYFVEMTPLTWNVSKEDLTSFLQKENVEMTVDLDILIGKYS